MSKEISLIESNINKFKKESNNENLFVENNLKNLNSKNNDS